MAKSIPMQWFLQALFGDRSIAAPAAEIGRAILAARSLRRTEGEGRGGGFCAGWTPGRSGRGPRPHQGGTPPSSEDRIRGGDTGFWLLLLATPHRGRAIPCGSEDDSRPG